MLRTLSVSTVGALRASSPIFRAAAYTAMRGFATTLAAQAESKYPIL